MYKWYFCISKAVRRRGESSHQKAEVYILCVTLQSPTLALRSKSTPRASVPLGGGASFAPQLQGCTSSWHRGAVGSLEPLAESWVFETCPAFNTTCDLFLVTPHVVAAVSEVSYSCLFFQKNTIQSRKSFLTACFQKLHSLPLTVVHFLSIWLQKHIPRRAGWRETEQPFCLPRKSWIEHRILHENRAVFSPW